MRGMQEPPFPSGSLAGVACYRGCPRCFPTKAGAVVLAPLAGRTTAAAEPDPNQSARRTYRLDLQQISPIQSTLPSSLSGEAEWHLAPSNTKIGRVKGLREGKRACRASATRYQICPMHSAPFCITVSCVRVATMLCQDWARVIALVGSLDWTSRGDARACSISFDRAARSGANARTRLAYRSAVGRFANNGRPALFSHRYPDGRAQP